MSPEESAKDILVTFERNSIGPGAALTNEAVKLAFFSQDGRSRTQAGRSRDAPAGRADVLRASHVFMRQ